MLLYVYIYIYTYIHTYIYTYIYIYIYGCVLLSLPVTMASNGRAAAEVHVEWRHAAAMTTGSTGCDM